VKNQKYQMLNAPHLPASLKYIVATLKVDQQLDPRRMAQIVEAANVKVQDLEAWSDFHHSPADSYGRKLVAHGPNFEVMVMSWLPGDFSAIHDHGHTQWGAVQIFGQAEHATFRVRQQQLRTTARWQVQPGDIVPVGHDLIHQMGNPTQQPFLSLHVYGFPEAIDNVTGDARIYDPVNGTIQRVDGGVFYALPPKAINKTEPGFFGDPTTQARHQQDLQHRLRQMQQARILSHS
jgi:predicted metal-dependent enzyme (double-stranded beta helix superfamily)